MITKYPEQLRALSVREPWASLLVHGCKNEEYRGRNTKRRGLVLIHSSLTYQIDWQEVFNPY
ncbi:MAG: ASCH domain-containing protein [Stigonema ocellatum SAG 48.90 = DSM 106950]|nr:ASCH domain-containing protein [Stigonema ocellatum SAG 48.90 = DSM 106950]